MQRPAEPAASRAWLLALVAAGLDLLIPLLPFWGNGSMFIFGVGLPAKTVAEFLVSEWWSALLILVGIAILVRSRAAVASGVFLAVGLDALMHAARELLLDDVLPPWRTAVVIGIWIAEGTLLLLAAATVWHAQAVARDARSDRPSPLS